MYMILCAPIEPVFDIKIKMCIKDKHDVQSCIITCSTVASAQFVSNSHYLVKMRDLLIRKHKEMVKMTS